MLSEREAIEVFHLEFLRVLGTRVDRTLYVLKGGCNLRFFARSIRYSEDMELDIRTMQPLTLRGNVEWVLTAPVFQQSLRTRGMTLGRISSPKQTDTTQRWKLQIALAGAARAIPTKIEFSRRGLDPGIDYEPVAAEIQQRYKLYQVLVQHYQLETAFRQKIEALEGRALTQARDVFDLNLLLDAGCGRQPLPETVLPLLPSAIENAISVGYDAFAGQVLAYLDAEYQDHYRRRKVWEEIQDRVVKALEGLRP
jgi:hypothetical protein